MVPTTGASLEGLSVVFGTAHAEAGDRGGAGGPCHQSPRQAATASAATAATPPEDGVVLNRVEGPVCSRCFASYKLKVASSRGNVDSRRSVMYLVRDIVERKGRAFYGVKT